jgi:two-component system chemotaxis response regulator CheB
MMAGRDVIAVGASAGGVEALIAFVAGLPAGLPAAVLVVLHVPPQGPSLLAEILSRRGPLPAAPAEDGEPLRHGRIYVARPNYHLLVQPGRVRVLAGPHENGLRPAIDPLFRSAARAYGARAVGVVLSGTGDDGAAGLLAIKRHGGAAVVQSPQDALFPGMPRSALAALQADACVPVAEIPALLDVLARTPVSEAPEDDNGGPPMTAFQAGAGGADETVDGSRSAKRENAASGFSCPECHGSLWEAEDGEQLWFECRVGHRYSFESTLAEQARTVEASIWAAINVLEERAALLRKQSQRAAERGLPSLAQRCEAQAQDAEAHADSIRTSLLGLVQSLSADPVDAP